MDVLRSVLTKYFLPISVFLNSSSISSQNPDSSRTWSMLIRCLAAVGRLCTIATEWSILLEFPLLRNIWCSWLLMLQLCLLWQNLDLSVGQLLLLPNSILSMSLLMLLAFLGCFQVSLVSWLLLTIFLGLVTLGCFLLAFWANKFIALQVGNSWLIKRELIIKWSMTIK